MGEPSGTISNLRLPQHMCSIASGAFRDCCNLPAVSANAVRYICDDLAMPANLIKCGRKHQNIVIALDCRHIRLTLARDG